MTKKITKECFPCNSNGSPPLTGIFQCFCGKKFTTKRDLMFHEQNHTEIRPHKCQFCGTAFTRKWHLKRHYNTCFGAARAEAENADNHLGQRQYYACDLCGLSFVEKHNLKRHLASSKKHQAAVVMMGNQGIKCSVPDCQVMCPDFDSLCQHQFLSHGIQFDTK